MRLKNPDQKFSADAEGASADILDQILGTTERKRARPASSLDIKVPNGEQLTRPPKQTQQPKYHDKPGRTRGGVPSGKFDFSDLEGMTEEEIMQALYDDPDLAAAAAAAAEKMQKAKQKKPPRTKPSSRRSRIVSEHPDHIRAMMDEGVPIKQWIILIVLLGAGLYQLYKSLVGSKAAAAKKAEKPVSGKKGSKKAKKGGVGVKVNKKPRFVPTVRKESPPVKEELTLVEQAPSVVVVPPKKAATKKKKARKQKVSSNKPTQQPARDTMSHDSPDSASTDGSSSTDADAAAQHEDTLGADDSEDTETIMIDRSGAEESPDDGWQTVGAPLIDNSGNVRGDTSNEKVAASSCDAAKAVVYKIPDPAMKPVKGRNSVRNSAAAETEHPASARKVSAQKEAATTAENTVLANSAAKLNAEKRADKIPQSTSEATDATPEIIDDEALALKLHLEEEKLAKHDAEKASQSDVWEEVSTKKKGKK